MRLSWFSPVVRRGMLRKISLAFEYFGCQSKSFTRIVVTVRGGQFEDHFLIRQQLPDPPVLVSQL
jgi:hypothetical protein